MAFLASKLGAAIFPFCFGRNIYTELRYTDLFTQHTLLCDFLAKQGREYTRVLGRSVCWCKEGERVLSQCLCTGVFVLSTSPDGSFLASHQSVQQLVRGAHLGFPRISTTSENVGITTTLKRQERRIIQALVCGEQCHSKAPRDGLRAGIAYCLAMQFCEAWARWMLYCF